MRNYSAMNMPVKGKMQLQILNSEHGITAYERARMALKLLVNYGKKKDYEEQKQIKEREQFSRKNAAIIERIKDQPPNQEEDLKSLLGSMLSTDKAQKEQKMRLAKSAANMNTNKIRQMNLDSVKKAVKSNEKYLAMIERQRQRG